MIVKRFEVPGLAHYSYLLGSNQQAVVIDPERNAEPYLRFAESRDLRITHILETHIHADYASGATRLANETAAELWLSGHDEGEDYEYKFPHREMRDGNELVMGDLRIVAVHTPGHTPEHLSFLVYEQSRCGQPMALFSGDFLFVGSLGRPDLLGEAQQKLAACLYESVHRKIAHLPGGVEIYPAHGAGSLCGSGMSERPQSTLGYERFCNVFMEGREQRDFVNAVLGSVPKFPEYYRRMKRVNADGPKLLDGLPGGTAFSAEHFQEQLRATDSTVIDLRSPEAFGGAHIPGALNIGAGQNLSMWAGWVVPCDRPILLIGDEGTDIESARRSLIRVGLDEICGWLKGGMRSWIEAGLDQAHVPQISVRELEDKRQREAVFVLDVRSRAEWVTGHLEGAVHIPGGELPKRAAEIPRDTPVHVICGSGYRSSIASSVLKRASAAQVVNVVGGMTAWKAQSLPEVGL